MGWWQRHATRERRAPQGHRGGAAAGQTNQDRARGGYEKPEVTAMTQGVMQRPHGLGFDETVGLDGAAGILDAAAAGPVLDRGLRAQGKLCARCGQAMTLYTPARRRVTGELVHDVCLTSY